MHHQYSNKKGNAIVNENVLRQYVNIEKNENMHHQYLNVEVIGNENENLPHQHLYEFRKINGNLSTQRENVHHPKRSKMT